MATRNDLERRLARLEANLSEMGEQYPLAGDFISAFAVHANGMTDDAADAGAMWAFRRVDDLLENYGF